MIALDGDLLKIILTSFFVETYFASVAVMQQKYYFKSFPHAEIF
jgi:hypothetical protein